MIMRSGMRVKVMAELANRFLLAQCPHAARLFGNPPDDGSKPQLRFARETSGRNSV
jgi:hypothetical protein